MEGKNDVPKNPYEWTRQSNIEWDTDTKEGRAKIEAHIENWILLLKDGRLICPNLSCVTEFSYPLLLIDHLKCCPSAEGMQKKILFRGTLPCVICQQEILINQYCKHFRSSHKDINENLKKINHKESVTCLNYQCAMKFQDCLVYMEHCTKCKPLFLCQDCQHTYQTSSGIQKHLCSSKSLVKIEVNEVEELKEENVLKNIDDKPKLSAGENGNDEQLSKEIGSSLKPEDCTTPSDQLEASLRIEQSTTVSKTKYKKKVVKTKGANWVRRSVRGSMNYESQEEDFDGSLYQQSMQINDKELSSSDVENAKGKDSNCVHSTVPSKGSFLEIKSPRGRPRKNSLQITLTNNEKRIVEEKTKSSNGALSSEIKTSGAAKDFGDSDALFLKETVNSGELPGFSPHGCSRELLALTTENQKKPEQMRQRYSTESESLNESEGESTATLNVERKLKKRGRPRKKALDLAQGNRNDDGKVVLTGNVESVGSFSKRVQKNIASDKETDESGEDATSLGLLGPPRSDTKIYRKAGRVKKLEHNKGRSDNEEMAVENSAASARQTNLALFEKAVILLSKLRSLVLAKHVLINESDIRSLSDSECCERTSRRKKKPVEGNIESLNLFKHCGSNLESPDKRDRYDQLIPTSLSEINELIHNSDAEILQSFNASSGISSALDTSQSKEDIFLHYFAADSPKQQLPRKRGRPRKNSTANVFSQKDNELGNSPPRKQGKSFSGSVKAEKCEMEGMEQTSQSEIEPLKKRRRPEKILVDDSSQRKEINFKKLLESESLRPEFHNEGVSLAVSYSDSEIWLKNKADQPGVLSPAPINSAPTAIYREYFSDGESLMKAAKKRGRPRKYPIPEQSGKGNKNSEIGNVPNAGLLLKKKVGRPKKISISGNISEDNSSLIPMHLNGEDGQQIGATQKKSDIEGSERPLKKVGRPKKISISGSILEDNSSVIPMHLNGEDGRQIDATEKKSDIEGSVKPLKKVGRPKKISISGSISEDNSSVIPMHLNGEDGRQIDATEKKSDIEGSVKPLKKVGRPKKISISGSISDDISSVMPMHLNGEDGQQIDATEKKSDIEGSEKPLKKVGRPKKISISGSISEDNSTVMPMHLNGEDGRQIGTNQKKSDIEGSEKPLKKVGRPKKISISGSISDDISSVMPMHLNGEDGRQIGTNQKKSDIEGSEKPLKKRGRPRKDRISKGSVLMQRAFPVNAAFQFSDRGPLQSCSLSDSESWTPCVTPLRVRSLSDSEVFAKPQGKREKCNETRQNLASRSHKTLKSVSSFFLGKIHRKRGRPSKADLLLRKQAASMLQANGTSGIEAQFVTPLKRKPGRKKKVLENIEATASSPAGVNNVDGLSTPRGRGRGRGRKPRIIQSTPLASSGNSFISDFDFSPQSSPSPTQKKKKFSFQSARRNKKLDGSSQNGASMLFGTEFKEKIDDWCNNFDSGSFKCPSSACGTEFRTWIGIFQHIPMCETNDQIFKVIFEQRTLSCHVCKQQLEIGSEFGKHARRYHKDPYDLTRGLETNGSCVCYNCDCNATLTEFNQCVKHGMDCGSLMKCEKCQRKYKARAYFASHKSKCPYEVSENDINTKSFDDSFEVTRVRRSAKKAIGAISKLDQNLDDDDSNLSTPSSKRSRVTDEDFDETSVISGDIEEELEEDDNEEEEDQSEEDLDFEDGETRPKYSKKSAKLTQPHAIKTKMVDIPSSLFCNSSKKPLKIRTIRGLSLKPIKPDLELLKSWFDENHSESLFPGWIPANESIVLLDKSETKSYLPRSQISPVFKILYEASSGQNSSTEEVQIPCLEAMPALRKSNTATFFVGGPVQALEWCPVQGDSDQYVAVGSHLDYNEVHTSLEIENNKGMIQIWKLPQNQGKRNYNLPVLAVGIVHDFGPVYSMKWCPSATNQANQEFSQRRLGILAVACSDGFARILSIPYPEDIKKSSDTADTENKIKDAVFVRIKPSLTLAASRVDAESVRGTFKATCIEWLPTKGHGKIAVGYADGSICIWNVSDPSEILSFNSKNGNFKALLPFTRIAAHNFAVRCLCWCANDDRFIASGSFEKIMKVFDIRWPDTPVLVFKRAVFENIFFPLQKTGIMLTEEECFNCVPAGLRYIDMMNCIVKRTPYFTAELATSHNSGCRGFAYNEWLEVAATSCIAGELVVKSCSAAVKSQRVPVYRIESEPLTSSNDEAKTQGSEAFLDSSQSNENTVLNETSDAIRIIKNKATELRDEIFKQKYTFKDTNFFEFREQALGSAPELLRVRSVMQMQSSRTYEHETRSISKVQWNPNHGSHHILASGGTLGIVRIHFFSNWL